MMKIQIRNKHIETDEETVDSLVSMHDELQERTNVIKNQLAAAKVNLVSNGEYADPDWFRRANYALRAAAHSKQVLVREISRRKKEDKQTQNNSFERNFIKAAKRLLHTDTYQTLLEEAQSMTDQN